MVYIFIKLVMSVCTIRSNTHVSENVIQMIMSNIMLTEQTVTGIFNSQSLILLSCSHHLFSLSMNKLVGVKVGW